MNDLETCREQILSEDTRDFISNPLRTPLFNELLKKDPCIQDAGLGYQCIYFSKELVEPISLARFSYSSTAPPRCPDSSGITYPAFSSMTTTAESVNLSFT